MQKHCRKVVVLTFVIILMFSVMGVSSCNFAPAVQDEARQSDKVYVPVSVRFSQSIGRATTDYTTALNPPASAYYSLYFADLAKEGYSDLDGSYVYELNDTGSACRLSFSSQDGETNSIEYVIDAEGNTSGIDSGGSSRLFEIEYDKTGQPKKALSSDEYGTEEIAYAYNIGGGFSATTARDGVRTLKRVYNGDGTLAQSFSYDSDGDAISGLAYDHGFLTEGTVNLDESGNELDVDIERDGEGRVVRQLISGDGSYFGGYMENTYAYDEQGNIVSVSSVLRKEDGSVLTCSDAHLDELSDRPVYEKQSTIAYECIDQPSALVRMYRDSNPFGL